MPMLNANDLAKQLMDDEQAFKQYRLRPETMIDEALRNTGPVQNLDQYDALTQGIINLLDRGSAPDLDLLEQADRVLKERYPELFQQHIDRRLDEELRKSQPPFEDVPMM